MSLVGPRPCIPYEYERYQPWQRRRFDAVPGLTGLWQVSGKNRTTFNEMIRLDIEYSERHEPLAGLEDHPEDFPRPVAAVPGLSCAEAQTGRVVSGGHGKIGGVVSLMKTMKETIKVGVVGCGYWGPNLIRNLRQSPECELKLLCDASEQRLAHMRRLHPGVATTRRFEDLLNGADLDAVVIATPVRSHYEMAKAA